MISETIGSKQAVLRIASKFKNTMFYAEKGESFGIPVDEKLNYKTVVVTEGESINNDSIVIAKVKEDSITIKTKWEFRASSYKNSCLVKEYGITQKFTFKKGEMLSLSQAGLSDAAYTVWIILEDIQ